MNIGLTPSERFVTELCQQSFLQLWTHPNPKGKKGKELCDCLIVCGPHIIIVSVKDNEYRETGDETGWARWTKVALDKSFSQIWGAERWLEAVDTVERADGRIITLPEKGLRQYHRIAIALGAHGNVPLKWGDFGNGFTHVCDEFSVKALFQTLDTIIDFVNFLRACEELARRGVLLLFSEGGIEDLLAFYIQQGNSFDVEELGEEQPDTLVFDSNLWNALANSEGFKIMQNKNRVSYSWDKLIELFAEDLLSDGMFDMHSKQATKNELALLTMALQPRKNRVALAQSFLDFFRTTELRSEARVVQGYAESAFVFTAGRSMDREYRARELALRCLVVRGRFRGVKTVVGIATDRPETSTIGYAADIVYVSKQTWTEKDELDIQGIERELGYFKSVNWEKL